MKVLESTALHRNLIENRLKELIPEMDAAYQLLYKAARYSLLLPAKRFRPLLVLSLLEDLNTPLEWGIDPACAIELVHTYSLIHDDLPCMDDDDLRRGQPTLHKLYGEAQAILAGDYLLTYAFEILSKAPYLSAEKKISLVQILSNSSGGEGMIGGQVIDLLSEGKSIDSSLLLQMFEKKTSALLSAALEFGGVIAETSPDDRALLKSAGHALGIAYQFIDDCLDVTSSESILGKPIGSDAANNKATCLTLFTLEEAQEIAHSYFEKAQACLSALSKPTPLTKALFNRCFDRLK